MEELNSSNKNSKKNEINRASIGINEFEQVLKKDGKNQDLNVEQEENEGATVD